VMDFSDVSLIATTYNQPGDLDLYLESLRQQSVPGFQIVIADDGSAHETRQVIERHKETWAGDRLVHVWHEDKGYRKAKIVNQAVRVSAGKWLIFTDSDLIVERQFVRDHVSQRAARSMFMGRRVDLGPGISDWIRANPKKLFSLEFKMRVLASGWGDEPSRNAHRLIRIGNSHLASALGCQRVPDLLGSNFSIDRDLIFEVNGFNEASEHYWGEDGDLYSRLCHVNARIHGRKNFAVQLHLWHMPRQPKPEAERAYQSLLADSSYRVCARGLRELTNR
jgi:glycosyltransferase involved in cell wall biosynthesis